MAKKITKFYQNGEEYLIKKFKGRTPGSNTIAYRPLTDDLNDAVGGYNLSVSGSDYGFTTNDDGHKCVSLNLGSNSSTTYFTNSSVYQQVSTNSSYTFAAKICDYDIRYSSWGNCGIFNFGIQNTILTIQQCSGCGGYDVNGYIPGGNEGRPYGGTTTTHGTSIHPDDGHFHSVVFVVDYPNKITRYVDGEKINDSLYDGNNIRTIDRFLIGKMPWAEEQGRMLACKLAHLVIDTDLRDENKIAAYHQFNG